MKQVKTIILLSIIVFLAISPKLLIAQDNGSYFGDGSDGDVVITTGTTLESDMEYNNLTVNSDVMLNTAGYLIKVNGRLINNGRTLLSG